MDSINNDIIIEPAEYSDNYYDSGEAGDRNGTREDTAGGAWKTIRMSQVPDPTYSIQERTKPLTLTCAAYSFAMPIEITWTRNNVLFDQEQLRKKMKYNNRKKYKIRLDLNNGKTVSKLIIRRPTTFDRGDYTCIVTSPPTEQRRQYLTRVMVLPRDKTTNPNRSRGTDGADTKGQLTLDDYPSQCVAYSGTACAHILAPTVPIYNQNPNDQLWMKRKDQVIQSSYNLMRKVNSNSEDGGSPVCIDHALTVTCLYSFPICDITSSDTNPTPLPVCKSECEHLENDVCKQEYLQAKTGGVMSENLDILPLCTKLNTTRKCAPVFEEIMPPFADALKAYDAVDPLHWCFAGRGVFYRGRMNTDSNGRACLKWKDAHPDTPFDHNYCRNPSGIYSKPYCYVRLAGSSTLSACAVSECDPNVPLFPKMKKYEKTFKSSVKPTDKNSPDLNSPGHITKPAMTTTDSSSTSDGGDSLSLNHILIIGGTIAGFILLVALVVLLCVLYRRSSKQRSYGKAADERNRRAIAAQQYAGMNGRGAPGAPLMMNGHTHLHQNGDSVVSSGYQGLSVAHYVSTPHVDTNGSLVPESCALLLKQDESPGGFSLGMSAGGRSSNLSAIVDSVKRYLPNQVQKSEMIGQGYFGEIFVGELDVHNGANTLNVVVKTLRDSASPRLEDEFIQEIANAQLVKQCDHILGLYGIVKSNVRDEAIRGIVYEYMPNGDLKAFLSIRAPDFTYLEEEKLQEDHQDFLYISIQLATALRYMAIRGIVHRDVAARNCLVGEHRSIKLCDFGFGRGYDDDYLIDPRFHSGRPLPVRWMAPEALHFQRYSEFSDVWSFGVTLWEMFTYGQRPYHECNNEEVIVLLHNRELLESIDLIPKRIYSLMIECWLEQPEKRPTFEVLVSRLSGFASQESYYNGSSPYCYSPAHSAANRSNCDSSIAGASSSAPSSSVGPPMTGSSHTAMTALSAAAAGMQHSSTVGTTASNSPSVSKVTNGHLAGVISGQQAGGQQQMRRTGSPGLQTLTTMNGVYPLHQSPLTFRQHNV